MKKVVGVTLIVTLSMIIITASVFIFVTQMGEEEAQGSEQPTIDEVIESSWDTEQLTTNLSSDHIIRASFRIQGDSEATRIDIEKRDFQIKNLIIHHLAESTAEELQSSEGLHEMEATLMEEISELLDEGSIVEVYTTERVIQ